MIKKVKVNPTSQIFMKRGKMEDLLLLVTENLELTEFQKLLLFVII